MSISIPRGSVLCSGFGDVSTPLVTRFFDPVAGAEVFYPVPYTPQRIGVGPTVTGMERFSGAQGLIATGCVVPEPNDITSTCELLDQAGLFVESFTPALVGVDNTGTYLVNDHVWTVAKPGAVYHFQCFSVAGALLHNLNTGLAVGSPFIESIAVDDAEATLYFAFTNALTGSVIHKYDIGTNTDLGAFITNAGAGARCLQQSLLVRSNGDVIVGWDRGAQAGFKRYDSTGALVETYVVPTNVGPLAVRFDVDRTVSPVVDDPTGLLLHFYDNTGLGYGVSFQRIDTVGGATRSGPFTTPLEGTPSFEWDGPIVQLPIDLGCPACPPPTTTPGSQPILIGVGPIVGGGDVFNALDVDDQMVQERFFAHQSLAPDNVTALKLTNSAIVNDASVGLVLVTVDGADCRYWLDGTDPTASVGNYAAAGNPFQIAGHNNIVNFRVICTVAGPATVSISAAKP